MNFLRSLIIFHCYFFYAFYSSLLLYYIWLYFSLNAITFIHWSFTQNNFNHHNILHFRHHFHYEHLNLNMNYPMVSIFIFIFKFVFWLFLLITNFKINFHYFYHLNHPNHFSILHYLLINTLLKILNISFQGLNQIFVKANLSFVKLFNFSIYPSQQYI
jgi:hypothetical protein